MAQAQSGDALFLSSCADRQESGRAQRSSLVVASTISAESGVKPGAQVAGL